MSKLTITCSSRVITQAGKAPSAPYQTRTCVPSKAARTINNSSAADSIVQMLAPLAPHTAEELWSRLGHPTSVVWTDFPVADPAQLVDAEVEVPVQVNGKVKARVMVPAGADADATQALALADPAVQAAIGTDEVRRVVVAVGRMVNVVV